jgi:hypothetical protein
MGLFIDSTAEAEFAGAFALEIDAPKTIEGVSLGYIGFVGQFSWGPVQQVVTPENGADFLNTFEPAGSPRTSNGYRALKGRKKLKLKVVRALAADAAAATNVLVATGGNITSTAKYKGTLGNAITRQIKAAASGDGAKRDFVFTLTDPVTGSTVETYSDVPLPAGGVQVTVDVSKSKLLASLVVAGAVTGWPANGTAALTGGSNGAALIASDYVGTEGLSDKGVALFENESEVRILCHDDCGNGIRAAVNAGFAAHEQYMDDRIAIVDTDADAANWAAVKAAVTGGLVSDRALPCGAWVQIFDDGGNLVTTPFSTFIASARINLEPHQSHAWRADRVTDYYTAIQGVVANFSVHSPQIKKEAFALGIQLPIKLTSGRWAAQHDRNSNTSVAKRYTTRRVMTDYLALSLVGGVDEYVNGPNSVEGNRELSGVVVKNFLEREKQKGRIAAYSINTSMNTSASIGAGEFTVAISAITISPREKIFFLLNVGPTVTITEQDQAA